MLKKILTLLVLAAVAAPAHAFDGPYFTGIWENGNYLHPLVSATTLLTTKGAYDGESTQVALVWHKADPLNSLIPQALQNVGVAPFSWALLSCGAGYGNGTAKLTCGSAVNFAPTLLGPVAQLLGQSSNALAQAASVAIKGTPDGTGLSLGYVWSAAPVADGAVQPLNHWGSHLDASLGLNFAF